MLVDIAVSDFISPIHGYTDWNIEDATYDVCNLSYHDFFTNHLLTNLPCIVKNVSTSWECSKKWLKDESINFEYLMQTYGDMEAPVADCDNILDYAQRTSQMKVSEFIEYLKSHEKSNLLYLKDLHLKKLRPNDNFYTVPKIFASDWLNEYAQDKNEDDFKFVYIGPKNSWTPIHADVYSSFSWSVNVIGRKKWILFPPGEEEKLKVKQNQLQLLFNPDKNMTVQHYEVVQEKGDAIFVPSGWYHQVENQLDTISINHNWNNGSNIHFMWKNLNKSLNDVENEIGEFKDSSDYSSQCQILLKALCGANYESFITFILHIAKKRLTQLQGQVNLKEEFTLGTNHIKFDLKMLLNVIESINEVTVNYNFHDIKQEIFEALSN